MAHGDRAGAALVPGDWIKMRLDLQSHPKVVRILSATQADKFRVIGGLHAVWAIFDTHSEDGLLHGYTPVALDHVIGWTGFAQAMMDVDWLSWDGSQTLSMPEFQEHNGQSAKRRAEDQKRKRDERKSPQSVRKVSEVNADKKRTREEKRRSNTPLTPQRGQVNGFHLPDWVPSECWAAFVEMRQRIRKPMTTKAKELSLAKLDALRNGGHDPRAVLEYAVMSSNQGLWPVPVGRGNATSTAERNPFEGAT